MVPQVDVWLASLEVDDDQLGRMRALLAPAEVLRAGALRTIALRRRSVAGRTFLRSVLAGYVGALAAEILLEAGPAGKPAIARRHAGEAPVEFNLSHAHERAVCAVATGVAVGVDLERIAPSVECEELAAACVSDREHDALLGLPPAERIPAFFATWTRKEARLKALGTGLSAPLARFAVPVRPEGTDPVPAGPWTLVDLPAPEGFAACLAVCAPGARVRFREWTLSARVPAAA